MRPSGFATVRVAVGLLAAAIALGCYLAGPAVLRRLRRPWELPPAQVFTPSLLASLRLAADLVPGDPPERLGVHVLARYDRGAAEAAEGAPAVRVPAVRAAYQIRYPRSWIMVDSGVLTDGDTDAYRASYDELQEALLGAQLIVFTHEHLDHVGGVVRSARRAELAHKVLFTRTQLNRLLTGPDNSLVRLEPDEAAVFQSFDYDPIAPIAPGVVLIRAPGHTPGSQFVYVRLKSGAEMVFAGDVAYLAIGMREGRQKPDDVFLDEDRDAIAVEMRWLRDIEQDGVSVLLSHDDVMLRELIARGAIEPDIDVTLGIGR